MPTRPSRSGAVLHALADLGSGTLGQIREAASWDASPTTLALALDMLVDAGYATVTLPEGGQWYELDGTVWQVTDAGRAAAEVTGFPRR